MAATASAAATKTSQCNSTSERGYESERVIVDSLSFGEERVDIRHSSRCVELV
jgi:hypothetical protein